MTLYGETVLSGAVISAAIAVHRHLGPGLDEPDYVAALMAELRAMDVPHAAQWPLPLRYKGVQLDCGYRIDVLVGDKLVVECKSVEAVHPVHRAQLLTYLRLSGREVGLLINFDVPVLKYGVERFLLSADFEAKNDTTISRNQVDCAGVDDSGDALTGAIVATAIEVHRRLGPGLLRSAYEECLCYELSQRSCHFVRKRLLGASHRGVELPIAVEVPLLVEGSVPVICLSVNQLLPLYRERLRALLRLGRWERGLVINFNETTLAQGLERVVERPAR